MRWARLLVIAVAAILLAPVSMAQGDPKKCTEAVAVARAEKLDGLLPVAGAVHAPGFVYKVDGPNCRVISIYRMPANPTHPSTPEDLRKLRRERPYAGKTAAPFMVARYVDDHAQRPYSARWTDQARCPALLPAIENLEPILAPKLLGDGPYRYGSYSSATDQPVIRFWMSGAVWPQDDAEFRLDYMLDGGSSASFGKWLFATFDALAPCWSDELPVLP